MTFPPYSQVSNVFYLFGVGSIYIYTYIHIIYIYTIIYISLYIYIHILIYIYLVQRKPNFLQDKNVNLVFSRVHCENIVFPEKTLCFPRIAK